MCRYAQTVRLPPTNCLFFNQSPAQSVLLRVPQTFACRLELHCTVPQNSSCCCSCRTIFNPVVRNLAQSHCLLSRTMQSCASHGLLGKQQSCRATKWCLLIVVALLALSGSHLASGMKLQGAFRCPGGGPTTVCTLASFQPYSDLLPLSDLHTTYLGNAIGLLPKVDNEFNVVVARDATEHPLSMCFNDNTKQPHYWGTLAGTGVKLMAPDNSLLMFSKDNPGSFCMRPTYVGPAVVVTQGMPATLRWTNQMVPSGANNGDHPLDFAVEPELWTRQADVSKCPGGQPIVTSWQGWTAAVSLSNLADHRQPHSAAASSTASPVPQSRLLCTTTCWAGTTLSRHLSH